MNGIEAASDPSYVVGVGHAAEQETNGVRGLTGVQGDEGWTEWFGAGLQQVKDGLTFGGQMGILGVGLRWFVLEWLEKRLAGLGTDEA